MNIVEYFTSDEKDHWLHKIDESDWGAGKFLVHLLRNNELTKLCGNNTKVLLLTEEDELISFCTLADADDIQPTELTPWIGFVYTFPKHRGNRNAGRLLDYAEKLASTQGFSDVYISTNEVGLYEKYGYVFLTTMKDINGEDSKVYTKKI